MSGKLGFGFLDEAVFSGLSFYRLSVMLVGVEVNGFGLAHEIGKNGVELTGPVDRLDSGYLGGFGLAEFRALPNRNVVVGFAHKKHFTVFRINGVWKEQ